MTLDEANRLADVLEAVAQERTESDSVTAIAAILAASRACARIAIPGALGDVLAEEIAGLVKTLISVERAKLALFRAQGAAWR